MNKTLIELLKCLNKSGFLNRFLFFCRNKSAIMSDDEREIENDLDSEVRVYFSQNLTQIQCLSFLPE